MKTLILTLLALVIVIETSQSSSLAEKFEVKKERVEFTSEQFSKDNLRKYIELKQIKHPDIVYAQAILETRKFTSTIFKENNNLFGMKYVHDWKYGKKRETTAIGSQYGHARYRDWKSSVDDYLLWQQMFKRTPIETRDQYFTLLKRYAENRLYVPVLKRIIEENKLIDIKNEVKFKASFN